MKKIVLPLVLAIAFLGYAPSSHAKKKKEDPEAGKTAIDILTDTAPATTATILAPLGSKVPEKLRADITALREKLLDEAAKAPVAPADAYKAAVALSDGFIAALDEKDKIAGTISKSAPMGTANMSSSTAVHPNEESLQQEAIDAKKKKQDDAKQNAFFNDAQKQQWTQRSAQWQKYLDQLYTQMGDIRRKADQAPAATPAAAPAAITPAATTPSAGAIPSL